MLLGWLLPDASYQVVFDKWGRTGYRPRHGKPPLAVRGAEAVAAALDRARQRYRDASEEDSVAGVLLADAPGSRRIDMPNSGLAKRV